MVYRQIFWRITCLKKIPVIVTHVRTRLCEWKYICAETSRNCSLWPNWLHRCFRLSCHQFTKICIWTSMIYCVHHLILLCFLPTLTAQSLPQAQPNWQRHLPVRPWPRRNWRVIGSRIYRRERRRYRTNLRFAMLFFNTDSALVLNTYFYNI